MYILNDFGENVPCPDLEKWARWLEGPSREMCRLRDQVGPLHVSTVFLGLDHSFSDGPPLLWEMKVFSDDSQSGQEHKCQRFTTMQDAHAFHRGYVKGLREKLKNTTVPLPSNKSTKPQRTP